MRSSDFEWDTTTLEVFTFLYWRFDVCQAKKIIHASPRNVVTCDVTKAFDLVHPRPPKLMALKIPVEWNKIDEEPEKYDLSIPLIGIKFHGTVMIIDGWHRIAKASESSITELPLVLLTDEESEKLGSPIISPEEEKNQKELSSKAKKRKKK
jgi:hypothetical protein